MLFVMLSYWSCQTLKAMFSVVLLCFKCVKAMFSVLLCFKWTMMNAQYFLFSCISLFLYPCYVPIGIVRHLVIFGEFYVFVTFREFGICFWEGRFPVRLVEMLQYWIPDLSVNSMCILWTYSFEMFVCCARRCLQLVTGWLSNEVVTWVGGGECPMPCGHDM